MSENLICREIPAVLCLNMYGRGRPHDSRPGNRRYTSHPFRKKREMDGAQRLKISVPDRSLIYQTRVATESAGIWT
jgi:hypothetical protein